MYRLISRYKKNLFQIIFLYEFTQVFRSWTPSSKMKHQIKVKFEDIQARGLVALKRRQYCPNHDFKVTFFCEHPACNAPYLCKNYECIQSHIHSDRVTLVRVDNRQLANKTQAAQRILLGYEKQANKALLMKNAVDSYKETLMDLFQELQDIKETCGSFKEGTYGDNMTFDDYRLMRKVAEKENKLLKKIQVLKERMKAEPAQEYEESVQDYMKKSKVRTETQPEKLLCSKDITLYLQRNIEGFDVKKAQILWDRSKQVEKIPGIIEGKTNLLFLMVGNLTIAGFYTPSAYPSLQQKRAKLPKSFIFLQEDKDKDTIKRFDASEASVFHAYISGQQLICIGNMQNGIGDGLRSFSHDLSQISYYLPTEAYLLSEGPGEQGSKDEYYANKIAPANLTIYHLSLASK